MHSRQKFGNAGEELACEYLHAKGYIIIAQQWKRLPLGEIDIVARVGDTLVFVEVKSRSTEWFGSPAESVTRTKRQKISKLIDLFRHQYRVSRAPYRFDVIGVLWGDGEPCIQHIKSVGVDG